MTEPALKAETTSRCSGNFLTQLEETVAIGYAVSLPLSMTASYGLFVTGMILWGLSLLVKVFPRAKQESTSEPKGKNKLAPLALPLLVYAAALAISGLFNGASQYGQPGTGSLTAMVASLTNFKSLIPYFWAFHVFSRNREAGMVSVWLLLIVSSVAGIWGTIQQVFDIHLGFKYLQGTGFLGGPMAFAGQMQIFSLLALALFFSGAYKLATKSAANNQLLRSFLKPLEYTPVFIFITGANLLGLLFAAERSAWLGAMAGIVLIAGMQSKKLLGGAVIGLSAISGLLWALVPVVRIRINAAFAALSGGQDAGVHARFTIWKNCLDLFSSSPLFGTGIFRFPHFNMPEAIVKGVSTDINHGHSNYLHMLAATGITGLASLLFIYATIIVRSFKEYRISKSEGNTVHAGLVQGLVAGTVSLMISGIFEYNFGTAQVRLAQWFLLGLL